MAADISPVFSSKGVQMREIFALHLTVLLSKNYMLLA